jgi:hypothetical protein
MSNCDAGRNQATCIEFSQAAQFGAVVKQAGVEEIGRQAPGLGLEFSKAQHLGLHRKGHEILGQRV